MSKLIESKNDCRDRDGGNESQECLDRKYLRSGKSYSNKRTVFKGRIPFHTSRNKLQGSLTTLKQNYINRESQMGVLSKFSRGRNVFRDVLSKIQSDDIIREILLRLPWSTITSLDTLCRRSLEKLLDRAFIARYLAENPLLLGFSYAKAVRTSNAVLVRTDFVPLLAAAKYCPLYCDLLQQSVEDTRTKKSYSDYMREPPGVRYCYSLDVSVCSCDGILLRFHTRLNANFMSLHNPITGQAVYLPNSPPGDRYHSACVISYGLAIDYFSSHTPELKVVELAHMAYKDEYYLRASTFSSKTCCWRSKKHYLEPLLGKNHRLSTRGIYFKGYMYWMGHDFGVVAYNLQKEVFSFRLLKIPGERVLPLCFCQDRCHKEHSCQLSMMNCVCRYLGVSQGCVRYIRVTGDSEISVWIVESGKWSRGQCFSLHSLPVSLLCGRILSVDPQDGKLLYIRLKTKIFSYHLELHELKEIHTILVEDENDPHFTRIPPILSYETPRLPASLALQDCFKNIFGSFLCSKETCWGDACGKFMIRPDVHVHIPPDAQSTDSYGHEWPFWFGTQTDHDWKATYSRFGSEHESLVL